MKFGWILFNNFNLKSTHVIKTFIDQIPEGYSRGSYKDRSYGITKSIFNHGNSIKIYAEDLAGKDVISLNYYITQAKQVLKPCEMPEQKVIHFLEHVQFENKFNTINQ